MHLRDISNYLDTPEASAGSLLISGNNITKYKRVAKTQKNVFISVQQ
jgi:hypothetical protein